jgi:predicted nucleotidyltransferase component of viral defense system
MIPKDHITAWRAQAPWRLATQVEQDLVMSRAIVDLFSVSEVVGNLVFRGGTALYKIYLTPPAEVLRGHRSGSGPGRPHRSDARSSTCLAGPVARGAPSCLSRGTGEPGVPLRVRGRAAAEAEAQDRDQHPAALHRARRQARAIRSGKPRFGGTADVSTYAIDELVCTKLRALYQRKQGRDLFDVWHAMDQGRIDPATLLACFERYMDRDERTVTRAQFEANPSQKRKQPDFRDDVGPILRPGFTWNFDAAMDAVLANLVAHLPGEPWKGEDG